jgi:hypothetical protein
MNTLILQGRPVRESVEDPKTGEVRHTSSAYLTFVAIGENGKPVAVAPVIAESEEEKRRYHEAGRRRAQRLAARNGFPPSTTEFRRPMLSGSPRPSRSFRKRYWRWRCKLRSLLSLPAHEGSN